MTGLPGPVYETDRQQIAALITNRAPGLSSAPTKFAGEQAGAFAQFSQSIGGDVDRAGKDAVPSSETSTQGLDNFLVVLGRPNGKGPGQYGRRGATYAQGFGAYLLGDIGTSWTAGQEATAGGITLLLRATVTVARTPPEPARCSGSGTPTAVTRRARSR